MNAFTFQKAKMWNFLRERSFVISISDMKHPLLCSSVQQKQCVTGRIASSRENVWKDENISDYVYL